MYLQMLIICLLFSGAEGADESPIVTKMDPKDYESPEDHSNDLIRLIESPRSRRDLMRDCFMCDERSDSPHSKPSVCFYVELCLKRARSLRAPTPLPSTPVLVMPTPVSTRPSVMSSSFERSPSHVVHQHKSSDLEPSLSINTESLSQSHSASPELTSPLSKEIPATGEVSPVNTHQTPGTAEPTPSLDLVPEASTPPERAGDEAPKPFEGTESDPEAALNGTMVGNVIYAKESGNLHLEPVAPPSDDDLQYQKLGTRGKETLLMRLKNRVSELELNLSLSSRLVTLLSLTCGILIPASDLSLRYLEELSQRYKRQMEEMYRSLNKTITKFSNTTKAKEQRVSTSQCFPN